MKFFIDKKTLLEKITLASFFTSHKIGQSPILQGVYFLGEKGRLFLYSTDLVKYFSTQIKIENKESFSFIVEPQKIIEFLNYLNPGNVDIILEQNKITIKKDKTTGVFPLIAAKDYPLPSKINKADQKEKAKNLFSNLEKIIFSAAKDQIRPVLTGVLFLNENEDTVLVTTDGFRLSLIKTKRITNHPPLILPAEFLSTIIRYIDKDEDIEFYYLEKDKMVVFKDKENLFYTRTIEGEFPPYEKVIPSEKETEIVVDKEELLKAVQLVSIFSRDQANIVIFEITKDKLLIRSKIKENSTEISAKTSGSEQIVAFNYKFLIELLKNIKNGKTIVIKILRPDAPVVFNIEEDKNFLHIIMPIRIQEE